ncbi:TPA: RND transporter, partial [Burkholderia vietnamiensis]|nr:RND transporter [Burkholderia vietnamiensis]
RATGARFADTARLYQAMGTPPADGAARTDTAANAGRAAPSDTGNGAGAAAPDTPPDTAPRQN